MPSRLTEIFEDKALVNRIKEKLPYLFQLAELDSSRDGKVGMEVGSLREKIIVALLIYKFGEENIETEIPITESETDVKVFGECVSIKTITKKTFGGVKLIWTVDAKKSKEFGEKYSPHCHMLLVRINWDGVGGLYFIPLEVQIKILASMGTEKYLKLPKEGTNPRGVEITQEALTALVNHSASRTIEIEWRKRDIYYNPYGKWVELWKID